MSGSAHARGSGVATSWSAAAHGVGALACCFAFASLACATHRGAGWQTKAADTRDSTVARATSLSSATLDASPGTASNTTSDATSDVTSNATSSASRATGASSTVRLFAFGDAGAGTGFQRQVTAELARALARPVAGADREIRVILWLGNNLGDIGLADGGLVDGGRQTGCAAADGLWSDPERAELGELAAVVQRQRAAGHASFAVLGPDDWRCDAPELEFQAPARPGPHPWVMPTYNYVARVYASGDAEVRSRCAPLAPGARTTTCTIDPVQTDKSPLLELVMLGTSPWNQPRAPTRGETAGERESLAQQRALLTALRRGQGDDGGQPAPLRLLVTHHPIETAGPHGQGGREADSSFVYALPELQAAIDDGLFAGAISGHDRNLQVAADISDGVKRSSRYWLDYPVFQVVAGATSRPDGRPFAGPRGWRWFMGRSLIPDLISTHAGFAELRVSDAEIEAILHARRRGRWRVGSVTIPRERPRHPVATPSPNMELCVGCDSRPPRAN